MIFLIDYDRSSGEIVDLVEFEEEQFREAEDARLRLDLKLFQAGITREVVLLEASSERALRKSHRRYFETVEQIVEALRSQASLRLEGLRPDLF